jgi:hypothetical protein
MAISSIGFPASSLLIRGQSVAAQGPGSKTLIANTAANQSATSDSPEAAQDGEEGTASGVDMDQVGGGSGSKLSLTSTELLKRLAELQEQMRQVQEQMRAAQNASYPTPEAKTTVIMGFQSQMSTITGAILQVSAALVKEMNKTKGIDTTA